MEVAYAMKHVVYPKWKQNCKPFWAKSYISAMHAMSSGLNMAHHIIWQINQSCVCIVSHDAQFCFIQPDM